MNVYIRRFDDYRSGTKLTVLDYDDIKSEYIEINSIEDNINDITNMVNTYINEDTYIISEIKILNSSLTPNTYNIIIIYGDNMEKTVTCNIHNTDNLDSAKSVLMHIFSDINKFQPFVITGLTCAYKQKGYYPDPLPPLIINNKLLIDNDLIKEIEDNAYYCVAIIVKDNILHDSVQIVPVN